MPDEEIKTEAAARNVSVEETESASTEPKGAGLRFKKSRSVCRKCRRAGEKLFLKGERCFSAKCSFTRRSYAPGQHGNKRASHLSQYGIQLREKQKLSAIYGLRERQLLKYYTLASNKIGKTGEILMQLIERRLDNVIFRAGLAASRRQARREISSGHVKVSGRRVDIPSFMVKKGEEIEIKTNQKENKSKDKIEASAWLKVEPKKGRIKVLTLPKRADIKEALEEQLIVEFYSK